MTDFYRKYKNLFLQAGPGSSLQEGSQNSKSYLKPIKQQMNHRVESLNLGNKRLIQSLNNKSIPSNRFENQILPQLSRLNQQYLRNRAKTQQRYKSNMSILPTYTDLTTKQKIQNRPQISMSDQNTAQYYSPVVGGKYKKLQNLNHEINNHTAAVKAMKRSDMFKRKFQRIQKAELLGAGEGERGLENQGRGNFSVNENLKKRVKFVDQLIDNPEDNYNQIPNSKIKTPRINNNNTLQQKTQKIPTGHQPPQPQHPKTQPSQPCPCLQHPDFRVTLRNPRQAYGYPQVNQGLIFSQYEHQNQYKLIDSRIRDIRWIQKYYPRGNINSYKEALLRRKQFKDRLHDRKARLKKLLADQQKEYDKKRSII